MDPGPPLREIGCFVLVAQRLSFSRAAAELGMSQPAVSQAVARLERGLGLRLFERTSREVQLTHAGKLLVPYAESLLEQAAAFSAEAARHAAGIGTPIRLAYDPLVGALAARVARRLGRPARFGLIDAHGAGIGEPRSRATRASITDTARHGDVELRAGAAVELRAAGWSAATAELTHGSASAAIMSTPFPAGFSSTARFHVPVVHLAVPTGSPLATATRLRLEQLGGCDVLLPRHRPRGSVWAELVTRLRDATGSAVGGVRIAGLDVDDLPAALDLVAADRGVLPAPRLLVETVRRPDVVFVPFDTGDLRMTYGLVYRQDGASPELMTLVRTVQETLRTR